jgi:hypothetical protein
LFERQKNSENFAQRQPFAVKCVIEVGLEFKIQDSKAWKNAKSS